VIEWTLFLRDTPLILAAAAPTMLTLKRYFDDPLHVSPSPVLGGESRFPPSSHSRLSVCQLLAHCARVVGFWGDMSFPRRQIGSKPFRLSRFSSFSDGPPTTVLIHLTVRDGYRPKMFFLCLRSSGRSLLARSHHACIPLQRLKRVGYA